MELTAILFLIGSTIVSADGLGKGCAGIVAGRPSP